MTSRHSSSVQQLSQRPRCAVAAAQRLRRAPCCMCEGFSCSAVAAPTILYRWCRPKEPRAPIPRKRFARSFLLRAAICERVTERSRLCKSPQDWASDRGFAPLWRCAQAVARSRSLWRAARATRLRRTGAARVAKSSIPRRTLLAHALVCSLAHGLLPRPREGCRVTPVALAKRAKPRAKRNSQELETRRNRKPCFTIFN